MKKYILLFISILVIYSQLTESQPISNNFSKKQTPHSTRECYLFIGSYALADSNSIFVYRFNQETGSSKLVSAVKGIDNPSFVTLSPNDRYLYAVSETHGGVGGHVYAYRFDRSTGTLHYLDRQLSGGDDPCNLTTDRTGRWLFVANYTSGSFSEFPLEKDGRIDKALRTVQHHGHGINPLRQEGPHVHCVLIAPNNRDVFVSDLGLDELFTYELNQQNGNLTPGIPPYVSVVPGRGPRLPHFSPDGRFVYLIQEMGGTITQFAYSPGKLKTLSTVSTIPPGYQKKYTAADIHFSPGGHFLYASNRDDLNDLLWYRVNAANGTLTLGGRDSSMGKTPRYFRITPNGKYVLVGHQNSDNIVIFSRNPHHGKLTLTPLRIPVAHAVCLKMIPDHG